MLHISESEGPAEERSAPPETAGLPGAQSEESPDQNTGGQQAQLEDSDTKVGQYSEADHKYPETDHKAGLYTEPGADQPLHEDGRPSDQEGDVRSTYLALSRACDPSQQYQGPQDGENTPYPRAEPKYATLNKVPFSDPGASHQHRGFPAFPKSGDDGLMYAGPPVMGRPYNIQPDGGHETMAYPEPAYYGHQDPTGPRHAFHAAPPLPSPGLSQENEPSRSQGYDRASIYLCNRDMWARFHAHTTEMIITKQGRRMFPTLQFSLTGLCPSKHYNVFVDMVLADMHHWKFQNGRWIACGQAEQLPPNGRVYLHPDSPNTGQNWMKQDITFNKLKLTNNKNSSRGFIVLNSMHRYQPRIHVIEVGGGAHDQKNLQTHSFVETQFVAVTAYQNTDITQLKIDNNPFAKGFRDSIDQNGDHCAVSNPSNHGYGTPPTTDTIPNAYSYNSYEQPAKKISPTPYRPYESTTTGQATPQPVPSSHPSVNYTDNTAPGFGYDFGGRCIQFQGYMESHFGNGMNPDNAKESYRSPGHHTDNRSLHKLPTPSFGFKTEDVSPDQRSGRADFVDMESVGFQAAHRHSSPETVSLSGDNSTEGLPLSKRRRMYSNEITSKQASPEQTVPDASQRPVSPGTLAPPLGIYHPASGMYGHPASLPGTEHYANPYGGYMGYQPGLQLASKDKLSNPSSHAYQ